MIADSMNGERKVVSLIWVMRTCLKKMNSQITPGIIQKRAWYLLGAVSTVSKPFSLYEELTYRVKCLLFFSRKSNLVCCISMTWYNTFWNFWWTFRMWYISKGAANCVYIININKVRWHPWAKVVYQGYKCSRCFC